MIRPGIEPRSPEPLANTLPISQYKSFIIIPEYSDFFFPHPANIYIYTYIYILIYIYIYIKLQM